MGLRQWVALLCLVLLTPSVGSARDDTYCVSGYSGIPPAIVSECGSPSVSARHRDWHFHTYVSRERSCYVCWDEKDNSCETDFLRTHRDFRSADLMTCVRIGLQDTGRELLAHVVDGQSVLPPEAPTPAALQERALATPSPTPTAAPVRLTPRLSDLPPGPYAVGRELVLSGSLRDEGGGLHPLPGGRLVLTDERGQDHTFTGALNDAGEVRFKVTLPDAASLKVSFLPDIPPLPPGAMLQAERTQPYDLALARCGYRAQLLAPQDGASLMSGRAVTLKGALEDGLTGEQLAPDSAQRLVFTVMVEGEAPIQIPAGADGTASWTPPPSPQSRQARISASGTVGPGIACPAEGPRGEREVSISDVGLALDTAGIPPECWTGLPCRGTLTLKRPHDPAARALADEALAWEGAQVRILDGRTELWAGPPRADGIYPFEATFARPSNRSIQMTVQLQGSKVELPSHTLKVTPALKLKLPEALDFGAVPAGTDVYRACQSLSFEASEGVESHAYQLTLTGAEGCAAQPMLAFTNQAGNPDLRSLRGPATVERLDPLARWIELCLDVPRCAGEPPPEGVALRITPMTAVFADQATNVRLTWSVTQRSPLACYERPLATAGGSALLLLLIAGWYTPHRFAPQDSVLLAGSERGLRLGQAINLVDCPGSSAGFFRNARLGIHGDGQINGRLRYAAVRLTATVEGLRMVAPGLEQQNRRTGQWLPVEDATSGHAPVPRALYRVGELHFKLETT